MEEEISEPQLLNIPDEALKIAEENLGIISEVILEKPIDVEFAKTYSRLYTIHSIAGIDAVLGGLESQPKMLVGFRDLLREAVKDAEDKGDFSDIARFLNSEREKMKGHPDFTSQGNLVDKLSQMINLLPTSPTAR